MQGRMRSLLPLPLRLKLPLVSSTPSNNTIVIPTSSLNSIITTLRRLLPWILENLQVKSLPPTPEKLPREASLSPKESQHYLRRHRLRLLLDHADYGQD
jgi:hypothetical protein